MGLTLELKWDPKELQQWEGDPVGKAIVRQLRNAGDRAARALVTSIVKYIQSKKKLKSPFIREGIFLKRPGAKADLGDLEWRATISGALIPLAQYPYQVKQVGRGAQVQSVSVDVGKSTAVSAFAFSRGGRVSLLARTAKGRYPLKLLFSSTRVDPLNDAGVVDGMFATVRASMTTAFEKAISEAFEK